MQERVLEYIRRRDAADMERLVAALGRRARSAVSRLVENGVVTRTTSWSRPTARPQHREYVKPTRDAPKETRRAPRQEALLARLANNREPLALTDARKQYGAGAVKALLDKGWIEKERVPIERDPLAGRVFPPSPPTTLTPRQADVAAEVRAALRDPDAAPRGFLLQGVTGSGKTEIYLDAVDHCLKSRKKAIVAVPEIALTHQTVERFAARFPGQVAVLHSRLSAGERFDQWWKVRRGSYDVVIGSRSAVFAPLPDLGIVVIDEEHEWTYKQHDASPRYHTREVALKLAELTDAVVLMGSASPDVATYYKGLRGEYRLLNLPDRVAAGQATPVHGARPRLVGDPSPTRGARPRLVGEPTTAGGARPRLVGEIVEPRAAAPLATVQVVDMRRELREGNSDIFSGALVSAMEECLEGGGQMILFLNRRGSSSHVQCRSCGNGLRCRSCDIPLTYHRGIDRLLCHYCGYRRIAPAKCPKCLSYRLSYRGLGTQSVADAVTQRFPDVPVLRWDRDATKGPRAYEELLERFRSGEARVLVGTQMIAKGLHFPAVTLVGAVSADVGLNIPDYRAGERAFQLLCQVAGRAGRGRSRGTVIIQTYQPENYAVRAAAAQDYQRFYEQELAFRRQQADPPFSGLIRLLYTHTNAALCERDARRFAAAIHEQRDAEGHSEIDVLGPTPAYPARLRGRYRWHLVLRGPNPRALLDQVPIPPNWTVDIDPVSLT